MNNPIKGTAIAFAIVSLVLFATCPCGAQDWTFDFDLGVDLSAYNTDKSGESGFSDVNLFLGASSTQPISERLSLFEGVHLRSINIDEGGSVGRDKEAIDVELGLMYVLTPWPPPPLRWLPARLPKWLPSLPKLKQHTNVYFKANTNFYFVDDSSIDQDNFNTTFFGIGWRYDNPMSKMEGSYIEIGTGGSERFDSNWRYIKNNIKLFYKLSDNRDGWRAFITTQLDVGSGDDDIRFEFGVTRDAEFLANMLKGVAGVK